MANRVILKEGREKPLLRGHPWIFSGAIDHLPEGEAGEIFPIYSSKNEFLGQGYFHPDNSLCGRVLTYQKGEIEPLLEESLIQAISLRKHLFSPEKTDSYRLVNGEGDRLPGLIVDRYGDLLVVQIHTQGMELLKPFILEKLIQHLNPRGIYEKSLSPARGEEGLPPVEGLLVGDVPNRIEILEEGKKFAVSIPEGQKTGFFLDQREMRKKVETLSAGRRVLNAFSYSGGFGIYALDGGALSVTSVDRCKRATMLAKENTLLNHHPLEKHQIVEEDFTNFLEQAPFSYDFVILDPPAFVKKRSALESALKGYENLNRAVLEKLPPQSFLLTCSCSYHVTPERFFWVIQSAALKAGRNLQILSHQLQAADHPILLTHPEGGYLKSFLLFVQ